MAVLCTGINRDVVSDYSKPDNEYCSIFLDSERIFAAMRRDYITLIGRTRPSIFRRFTFVKTI